MFSIVGMPDYPVTPPKFNLVGGFNPFEKICLSNWIISPGRDENKQYLKPPPRLRLVVDPCFSLYYKVLYIPGG